MRMIQKSHPVSFPIANPDGGLGDIHAVKLRSAPVIRVVYNHERSTDTAAIELCSIQIPVPNMASVGFSKGVVP